MDKHIVVDIVESYALIKCPNSWLHGKMCIKFIYLAMQKKSDMEKNLHKNIPYAGISKITIDVKMVIISLVGDLLDNNIGDL